MNGDGGGVYIMGENSPDFLSESMGEFSPRVYSVQKSDSVAVFQTALYIFNNRLGVGIQSLLL